MHKAKCVKASEKKGALMFMLDEFYSVERCKYVTLNKYVVVAGKFTNSHNETFNVKRIFTKELCQKHLKIV